MFGIVHTKMNKTIPVLKGFMGAVCMKISHLISCGRYGDRIKEGNMGTWTGTRWHLHDRKELLWHIKVISLEGRW